MTDQLAKPTVIKNPTPALPTEMTLVGMPEKMPSDPNNIGDSLAASVTNSNGSGGRGGMGTGMDGGLGPDDGPGQGPGKDGGKGGDIFRSGMYGVGWPACFYSPQPPYSDEARQAKYSGTVLVDAVVNRHELSMPPKIELAQAKGFSLYMLRAALNGKGDELLDLAKSNLWR